MHEESHDLARRHGTGHESIAKESADGKKYFPVVRMMSLKMLISCTIGVSMHIRENMSL
jgi:hypothetical protein